MALGVSRNGAESEPLEPEPVQTGGGKRGDDTGCSPCFQGFLAHGVLCLSQGALVPYELQLVIDRFLPLDHIAPLLDAGVDSIQIRIRAKSTVELLRYTREAVQLSHAKPVRVTVNTRVDVALAAGADGVQLPGHGVSPGETRLIAPALAIGRSVHSVAEALVAEHDGAHWITFGHVYASASHPGEPGRGLAALEEVVSASPVPVIAIGGLSPGNVAEVVRRGAAGVAVIGSVWNAKDPVDQVRRMREELDS